MNDIIKDSVPIFIQMAGAQDKLGSMPKPFERENLLGKVSVLQKYYHGKPEDLKIPIGSSLSVSRDGNGSGDGDIVVESTEYDFRVVATNEAIASLINAGFEMSGKLMRVGLERIILPDLNVGYFQHIEIEIFMKG